MSAASHPSIGEQAVPRHCERGFSLMEAIIATVIAVIAILGLAHSFGTGRAMINRYQSARDALALAQRRMEILASLPLGSSELNLGTHGPNPVQLNAQQSGVETWTVHWVDDPADGQGGGDLYPMDYKRVTVSIAWNEASWPDSVALARQFLSP